MCGSVRSYAKSVCREGKDTCSVGLLLGSKLVGRQTFASGLRRARCSGHLGRGHLDLGHLNRAEDAIEVGGRFSEPFTPRATQTIATIARLSVSKEALSTEIDYQGLVEVLRRAWSSSARSAAAAQSPRATI